MTRTVDALVSAARQEAGLTSTTSDARDAVREATASVQDEADAAGIEIRVTLPSRAGHGRDRGRAPRTDRPAATRQRHPLRRAARLGRAHPQRDERDDHRRRRRGRRQRRRTRPHLRARRAGRSGRRCPGGAGLGLALAQRLARSAGGEIAANPTRPAASSPCHSRSPNTRLETNRAEVDLLREREPSEHHDQAPPRSPHGGGGSTLERVPSLCARVRARGRGRRSGRPRDDRAPLHKARPEG